MIDHIWSLPYMISYMIVHIWLYRIWLTVYDWPYMIARIWSLPYMISYMTDHIWFYRIWLTVYDWPYMITVYDRVRIWLTIYDWPHMITVYDVIYGQPHMINRIWSYIGTIYDYYIWLTVYDHIMVPYMIPVYDGHIWSPPPVIYGLPMRWS